MLNIFKRFDEILKVYCKLSNWTQSCNLSWKRWVFKKSISIDIADATAVSEISIQNPSSYAH